jgi:DNA-directed RNA polymerase specialized sigma24 family protein
MTVFDAFDLASGDDAELAERLDRLAAAAAEARTTIERRTVNLDPRARDVLRMRFHDDLRQWDVAPAICCPPVQVSRFIRTSYARLSARASVACGAWPVGDTTEGATA